MLAAANANLFAIVFLRICTLRDWRLVFSHEVIRVIRPLAVLEGVVFWATEGSEMLMRRSTTLTAVARTCLSLADVSIILIIPCRDTDLIR
jgi:hypothetical protein